MGAAGNYPERAIKVEQFPRRLHRRYLCALLSLLVALGVLAFVFSAISPIDDDIQQEFYQSPKSKEFVLPHKKVSNLRSFPAHTLHSALPSSKPQFAGHKPAVCVFVPGDEIKARVCSSRSGDRSPPTRST
jgi:hypothetical protein